ncbi:MAG TPA: hypothetical protein VGB94_08230 [Acidobacteriaceae bacterium]
MTQEQSQPQTFVEMVLVLLEDRFPWLASAEAEHVSGADTIDELSSLHQTLIRKRSDAQRNTVAHGN